jgi:uncharacterized membrane protein YjfL (UPF0719 family)
MWQAILINSFYAGVATAFALTAMFLGFKMMDRLTKFDTGQELKGGNVAVGIAVGGMFIGLGLAIGLVVGLSLN